MKTISEYLTPSTNKKWYEEFPKAQTICTHSKSEVTVMDLKAEAKKHLETETTAYQLKESKSRNSEHAWLKTAISQGTSSDKVAASIVLIQDSPKHNLSRLTSLIGQVRAAKQNQCGIIIMNLRDLFLSDLLHPKFKLLKFQDQDLDKLDTLGATNKNEKGTPFISRNKLLAHWYFEDQLREIYEKFVVSLSQIASNTVDSNREKAVSIMNDLLMGNPEQEQKLLDFLVNKIGDPSSKVASKVIFCLNKLLFEHSNMKVVVLREVEKLLFRNNVSPRAQYYAICLLTQFVLDRDDVETANSLIDVYFAFFKACLKKGEPDSRMMAAILTGVNRAYRFAKIDSAKLNDHIDSLYKVVHVGSFNVSLNALSLLFQVVGKNDMQLNRFYSAFYRKLLDPQIGVVNKQAMFLNLLYRVLRNDHSIIRLQAFLKRIFQIILYYPSNMTCSSLYVVSQILKTRKDARNIMACFGTEIQIENNTNEKEEGESDSEDSEKADEKHEEDSNLILSNVTADTPKVVSKNELVVEMKEESKIKDEFNPEKEYDPFCRNPLGSGANNSYFHELFALVNHVHPSVSLFANNIMKGKTIDYTGDPLADLNLIRFLDRYVYKNPKKLENKDVTKKAADPLAQRAGYVPQGIRSVPVDSEAYLNEQEEQIPVDELFLYRFLKGRKDSRIKVENDEDDNDSVTSDDFNAMLDGLAKDKDLEELDFAGDINTPTSRKKGKSSDDEEDEIDVSDLGEDEDLEEEEEDLEDEEEMEDFSDEDLEGMDDDFSDMEFSDQDSDEDTLREELSSMKKSGDKSKKSKGSEQNVFMSAEKFADMMEKQGSSKFKQGGSNAMSAIDGAGYKQLNWEAQKNQRFSGSRYSKKGKRTKTITNNKSAKKQKR